MKPQTKKIIITSIIVALLITMFGPNIRFYFGRQSMLILFSIFIALVPLFMLGKLQKKTSINNESRLHFNSGVLLGVITTILSIFIFFRIVSTLWYILILLGFATVILAIFSLLFKSS